MSYNWMNEYILYIYNESKHLSIHVFFYPTPFILAPLLIHYSKLLLKKFFWGKLFLWVSLKCTKKSKNSFRNFSFRIISIFCRLKVLSWYRTKTSVLSLLISCYFICFLLLGPTSCFCGIFLFKIWHFSEPTTKSFSHIVTNILYF